MCFLVAGGAPTHGEAAAPGGQGSKSEGLLSSHLALQAVLLITVISISHVQDQRGTSSAPVWQTQA